MLVEMLGFGGRIGRLRFLVMSVGVLVLVGMAIAVAVMGAPRAAPGTPNIPWGAIAFCFAVIIPAGLWASLALQAKRVRDIGWPPLPVIGGYYALTLLDKLVAGLVPSVAVHGGGTPFGAAINLAMLGVLLLWPGADEPDWAPVSVGSTWRPPEPAAPVRRQPAPAAPAPAGFGRRGL